MVDKSLGDVCKEIRELRRAVEDLHKDMAALVRAVAASSRRKEENDGND